MKFSKDRQLYKGTFSKHPRGFGFITADSEFKLEEDIFIPKNLTMNALDGDKVEFEIVSEGSPGKGPDGKIVSILTRARTHLAGTVKAVEGFEATVYCPLLGSKQMAEVKYPKKVKPEVGDRIVMEVIDWGDTETPTRCRYHKKIGHISDPSSDVTAAAEEFELRAEFPEEVLREAATFGTAVTKKDLVGRKDFRELECVTIDPDTAKDYDDAISLTKDQHHRYYLGVHIADVSHYVRAGSALDNEAKKRCNSTYFPGQVIPMLPEALSNGLCSLKEGVNRLAFSVMMTFDRSGKLLHHEIVRSVIRSEKRFTYRQAKEVMDGKKKSKHKELLEHMRELCHLLKKHRAMRGSVEFSLPETVVLVDQTGTPTGFDVVEYDITHQMIEEFMLKANEVIAKHLHDTGAGVSFRIHEKPDPTTLKEYALLSSFFGFQLPENPSPFEFQAFFDEVLKTPYAQHLAVRYIRSMKMAYYSPNNVGHYGLALEHYCHFTSPIRRYVDLVAHRALETPVDLTVLTEISESCSEQERISSRAESDVVVLKKLRFLESQFKENPQREYRASITEVKPFGLIIDLEGLHLEGFLRISELEDDYFIHEPTKQRLVGRHSRKMHVLGGEVLVRLVSLDLISRNVVWRLSGGRRGFEGVDNRPPRSGKKKEHRKEHKKERSYKTSKPRPEPKPAKSAKGKRKRKKK